VRASNIDIQVGTSQRQPAVSTDQFPSHASQQSGQQRCEESTPSHSAVSIQNGQRSEENVILFAVFPLSSGLLGGFHRLLPRFIL
jgi:hypothetical protein